MLRRLKQPEVRTIGLLLLLVCLLMLAVEARGAPAGAISAGDLAIVGLNLDGNPKSLAMVALSPLAAATEIKLTDRGWIAATGSFFDNNAVEGTIIWTTPANQIAAGTVIMFELAADGVATLTPALGTTSVSGFSVADPQFVPWSGGGEQLLIYTGDDASPSFIYGFSNTWVNGSPDAHNDWQAHDQPILATGSNLPAALATGPGETPLAVAFNGHGASRGVAMHVDNLVYDGVRAGSRDDLLSAIGDQSNWAFDDVTPFDLTPGGSHFGPNPVFTLTAPTTIGSATGSDAQAVAVGRLPLLALLVTAIALASVAALRRRR